MLYKNFIFIIFNQSNLQIFSKKKKKLNKLSLDLFPYIYMG
jgi:hypothetical protein